eukprot:XP_001697741.1 predicted protein [Chlamydomonas reinhardtii]
MPVQKVEHNPRSGRLSGGVEMACLWWGEQVVAAAVLHLNRPPPTSASSGVRGSPHLQVILQGTETWFQKRYRLGRLLVSCIMQTAVEAGHTYITALVPDDEHALFWARVGFRRQPVANIAELPALHATLEQSRRQQGLVSGASVWYAELPAKAIADAQQITLHYRAGGLLDGELHAYTQAELAYDGGTFRINGLGELRQQTAAMLNELAVLPNDGGVVIQATAAPAAEKRQPAAERPRTRLQQQRPGVGHQRARQQLQAAEEAGTDDGDAESADEQSGDEASARQEPEENAIVLRQCYVTTHRHAIYVRWPLVLLLLGPDAAVVGAPGVPLYDSSTGQEISGAALQTKSSTSRKQHGDATGLGRWLDEHDAEENDQLLFSTEPGPPTAAAADGAGGSATTGAPSRPRIYVALRRAQRRRRGPQAGNGVAARAMQHRGRGAAAEAHDTPSADDVEPASDTDEVVDSSDEEADEDEVVEVSEEEAEEDECSGSCEVPYKARIHQFATGYVGQLFGRKAAVGGFIPGGSTKRTSVPLRVPSRQRHLAPAAKLTTRGARDGQATARWYVKGVSRWLQELTANGGAVHHPLRDAASGELIVDARLTRCRGGAPTRRWSIAGAGFGAWLHARKAVKDDRLVMAVSDDAAAAAGSSDPAFGPPVNVELRRGPAAQDGEGPAVGRPAGASVPPPSPAAASARAPGDDAPVTQLSQALAVHYTDVIKLLQAVVLPLEVLQRFCGARKGWTITMDTERVEVDNGVAGAVGEAAAAPAPPAAYMTTMQVQSEDVSATATGKTSAAAEAAVQSGAAPGEETDAAGGGSRPSCCSQPIKLHYQAIGSPAHGFDVYTGARLLSVLRGGRVVLEAAAEAAAAEPWELGGLADRWQRCQRASQKVNQQLQQRAGGSTDSDNESEESFAPTDSEDLRGAEDPLEESEEASGNGSEEESVEESEEESVGESEEEASDEADRRRTGRKRPLQQAAQHGAAQPKVPHPTAGGPLSAAAAAAKDARRGRVAAGGWQPYTPLAAAGAAGGSQSPHVPATPAAAAEPAAAGRKRDAGLAGGLASDADQRQPKTRHKVQMEIERIPGPVAMAVSAGGGGAGSCIGATFKATVMLHSSNESTNVSATGRVAADKETARQLAAAACLQQLRTLGVSRKRIMQGVRPKK